MREVKVRELLSFRSVRERRGSFWRGGGGLVGMRRRGIVEEDVEDVLRGGKGGGRGKFDFEDGRFLSRKFGWEINLKDRIVFVEIFNR